MLTIYFLFLCSYIFNKGFFNFPSIYILIIAFTVLLVKIFTKYLKEFEILSPQILLFLLTVLSLVLYGGIYQENIMIVKCSQILLWIGVALSLFLINSKKDREIKLIFWSMFISAFAIRVVMILSSPSPAIDVFDFLKYGSLDLLSGINPYSSIFHTIYPGIVSDIYPYLPGMIFSTIPSVFIFHDPRYTFVLSEILISLLILKILPNDKRKYIYSLLFLFNPMSPFIIEQSWTEPLMMLLITLVVWLHLTKRNLAAILFIGLTLTTKQYLVFLLPFALKLIQTMKERFKSLVLISMTILIIVIPFFIWNRADFIHDVLLLGAAFFRTNGLTVFALLSTLGIRYNSILSYLLIIFFIGLAYLYLFKNQKIKLSKLLILSSFTLFSFFLFNSYAFINFYYLTGQLMLLGIVLQARESKTP